MKKRIACFLLTYAVFVLLFAVQHPLFMAFYHDLYGGAGFSGAAAATWHGLRLDLSMAGYLTVIPGLLLLASVWAPPRTVRIIQSVYFAVMAFAISLVAVVDVCLYDFWGFRLDFTPVFYFMSSPADSMASVSPWFVAGGVAAVVVLSAGVFFLLRRVCGGKLQEIEGRGRRLKASGALLALTALLFIPIRGSFTASTMNLSVAYFSQNQRLNHAAINPMFSFMYSALHQSNFGDQFRFMDAAEADRLFAGLTDKPVEAADSVPRLFSRQRPNVIFVILESFSSHLMPSLGGEPIAVNLDRMAGEGVLFTNFFANSFRTDRGLVSIISGYPAQPNTSIMKYAEKVERLPSIPRAMKKAGYDLGYYYGGDANFTNMQAYLVSAGFDRIVSDKDFPLSQRTGKWGAHDHYVFGRLLSDLRVDASSGKPLLRILQTSSSHEPFEVPYTKFGDKVKNAFAYADDCLGKFIEELKKTPIWENTVVVLVPDHQGGYPAHVENPIARHHIPLVIVGGAVEKPLQVEVFGSQIDIAATLLYQLGIGHDDFVFSKNMLNPASPHFAYFTEPSLFGMVTADNGMVFNLDGNCVMADEGSQRGKNLEPGKAFLQKLYDDLDKR